MTCGYSLLNSMNEPVTIFIEPIDVTRWKLFQQHYDPFITMVDAGVFQVRNGSVSLHFDALGVLQVIQRSDNLYSRKHK